MDRKPLRGEGSGERSSSSSREDHESGWENTKGHNEISQERLLEHFTEDEVKLAQYRIDAMRSVREDNMKIRCNTLLETTGGLFSEALQELLQGMKEIDDYLKVMPENPNQEQKVKKDIKSEKLFHFQQAVNRLRSSSDWYKDIVTEYYQKAEYPRNEWHKLLEKLEFPVKENKLGFTAQDRDLLRKNIMELDKIRTDYDDESHICRTKNAIRQSTAFAYFREKFVSMDAFKEWLGPFYHVKVKEQDYKTDWDALVNNEFNEVLKRAQKYAENFLEPQEPWNTWFKNPFRDEE